MTERGQLAGSARLVLTPGVAHLDPAEAVFRAMVDGWGMQQRTPFLSAGTISASFELVRRVTAFTNEYPWRWTAPDVESFIEMTRASRTGRHTPCGTG